MEKILPDISNIQDYNRIDEEIYKFDHSDDCGLPVLLSMLMEESSELIQVSNKILRNKGIINAPTNKDDNTLYNNLIEEIADVTGLIKRINILLDIDDNDLDTWIKYKQNRLISRMNKERGSNNEV